MHYTIVCGHLYTTSASATCAALDQDRMAASTSLYHLDPRAHSVGDLLPPLLTHHPHGGLVPPWPSRLNPHLTAATNCHTPPLHNALCNAPHTQFKQCISCLSCFHACPVFFPIIWMWK
uniref:4Fe-4S ferredoxin-type domain-containing protein n=1 Tax=Eutreptiella gymnastica TaxID=73025 RepID=A0A7S4LJR8_9EUGL